MRFEKGMAVYTAQGEKVGSLNRVVIDARTRDVTDLVVERGLLPRIEKVIPIGLVDQEHDDRIQLRATNQGVDDFPDYETAQYIPIENVDVPYEDIEAAYWYPPANAQLFNGGSPLPDTVPDYVLETETSIPEGRIAISQGAQVFSADDRHIGDVEEVIMNSESNQLTHFVVGKGFLLKEHKLVPVHWVDRLQESRIYLSVVANVFERLPDYQPDE